MTDTHTARKKAPSQDLTRKISLNPLRTSRTTFLIWGTSLKILSGRRQRSIISSWAPDLGGTSVGSQHRKIRLTWTTSAVKSWQRVWRKLFGTGTCSCCCPLPALHTTCTCLMFAVCILWCLWSFMKFIKEAARWLLLSPHSIKVAGLTRWGPAPFCLDLSRFSSYLPRPKTCM